MAQFKLSITLGNDTMQTGPDLAAALMIVASKLDGQVELKSDVLPDTRGIIRDLDGNTVGLFEVSE